MNRLLLPRNAFNGCDRMHCVVQRRLLWLYPCVAAGKMVKTATIPMTICHNIDDHPILSAIVCCVSNKS